jgi:hypothetical protein
VAAYKKRPQDVAPIWRSSMRAASSWFPPWSEPGRRGVTRLICAVLDTGQKSRPSPRSASRRAGDASPCMPGSIVTRTSSRPRSSGFSSSCSGTSVALWSFFGTAAGSTGASWCGISFKRTLGSTRIVSRGTPRSSTPMNTFGVTSSAPWRTASRATSVNSSGFCILRSSDSGNPRNCSGRASMRPICHGDDVSITYA